MTTATKPIRLAVFGNPNTGKSTVFNALTGMSQQVANFPGCTVERKTGALNESGIDVELIDLPGTYSLAAASPDELIAVDVLLGRAPGMPPLDGVLIVADATTLHRNLYLVSQILDTGLPAALCLNMMDVADNSGIRIDVPALQEKLQIPVIPTRAHKGAGLAELKASICRLAKTGAVARATSVLPGMQALQDAAAAISEKYSGVPPIEALRALVDRGGAAERRLLDAHGAGCGESLEAARAKLGGNPAALEARARYEWVGRVLQGVVQRPKEAVVTATARLDGVLTHKILGLAVFVAIMAVVFQSIFSWSSPLMDLIEWVFGTVQEQVGGHMADGMLKSLVVDGIIGGVGGVVIFVPQIAVLFLFIAILEDCGYMARAAFVMDKLFSVCGLSGKSFLPLLSSYACAVPGVMAARTIENRRDRLTTILVAPLMSCSARLPVYTILIAAFIPDRVVGNLFNLQGLTLFAMYSLGMVVAIPVAWALKATLLKGETPPFLMELPSYKMPGVRTVVLRMLQQSREFIVRAGTLILALTVIIWALSYFPRPQSVADAAASRREAVVREYVAALGPAIQDCKWDLAPAGDDSDDAERLDAAIDSQPGVQTVMEALTAAVASEDDRPTAVSGVEPEFARGVASIVAAREARDSALAAVDAEESGEYLRHSFMGRMGRAIEPLVMPLGWDWKIGMAAIASFPAREVIIASLGTIYNLGGDQDEESVELREAMRAERWPDGRAVYTIPTALSIMVFFALCAQCAATLATIRRESGSGRWAVFCFVYMTALAYAGALLTYQIGMAWGGAA